MTPSPTMNGISSFKQKVLFSTVLVSHGVKKLWLICSMSLWRAMAALNLSSLLVLISSKKMKEKFGNACVFGLYRDDGLGISNASPRRTEIIKQDMCSIFRNYGLKITRPTKKLSTSSMSHSTCPLENTRPTQNPDTSHPVLTSNQTIFLALLKTFRNPSTSGCPKSPLMNIHFTKRHPFIRKL